MHDWPPDDYPKRREDPVAAPDERACAQGA